MILTIMLQNKMTLIASNYNYYKNASTSQVFFTSSFLEKMKNSSPEKLSANCMPTDKQQAVGWPTEV